MMYTIFGEAKPLDNEAGKYAVNQNNWHSTWYDNRVRRSTVAQYKATQNSPVDHRMKLV